MKLTSWLEAGARWIDWRDLAHVLSPAAPFITAADFALRKDPERLDDDLAARDPEFVAWLSEGALGLGRLFRLAVHGLANVPAQGPALLVGNHNGGLLPLDSLFTLAALCQRFGPERAVRPLGHDLIMYDRVAHRLAAAMGVLRAGHTGAMRAFERGDLVLVYPGSDLDSFRPWRRRHAIELAGRTGFIALALRAGVPIIPVVAAGTHEQWLVLTRGDRAAKLFGTGKLLRTRVLPLALALPWGLSFGLFPYLPIPAQTSLAFGHALAWPHLGPEAADDGRVLTACYHEVEAAMQAMLDALALRRRPFLGQAQDDRAAIEALVG